MLWLLLEVKVVVVMLLGLLLSESATEVNDSFLEYFEVIRTRVVHCLPVMAGDDPE